MRKWQAFGLVVAIWGTTVPSQIARIFFMMVAAVSAMPSAPWNTDKEDTKSVGKN